VAQGTARGKQVALEGRLRPPSRLLHGGAPGQRPDDQGDPSHPEKPGRRLHCRA